VAALKKPRRKRIDQIMNANTAQADKECAFFFPIKVSNQQGA